MTRSNRGTGLVLLADMAAALGVIIIARVFLDLSDEGFFLLTGITLALALLVGALLGSSPTSQERSSELGPN